MQHIGTDIIEINRIEQAIRRHGERFLHRVFTDSELVHYHGKIPYLAGRLATKEAVYKALGSANLGISWHDIEILSDPHGKPRVQLYSNARRHAESIGLVKLNASISHCRDYAIAVVIGDSNRG